VFSLNLESMEKDEAKWNDWQCFLKMLEEVSVNITEWCRNLPELERKHIYCGVLDSLIDMMKKLDCTSLSVMKDIILESPFFWDLAKREKFFANTVSLKLTDETFMNRQLSVDPHGTKMARHSSNFLSVK